MVHLISDVGRKNVKLIVKCMNGIKKCYREMKHARDNPKYSKLVKERITKLYYKMKTAMDEIYGKAMKIEITPINETGGFFQALATAAFYNNYGYRKSGRGKQTKSPDLSYLDLNKKQKKKLDMTLNEGWVIWNNGHLAFCVVITDDITQILNECYQIYSKWDEQKADILKND